MTLPLPRCIACGGCFRTFLRVCTFCRRRQREHLIRNSLDFANWTDRKSPAAALKPI